jgi:hypothetical protein
MHSAMSIQSRRFYGIQNWQSSRTACPDGPEGIWEGGWADFGRAGQGNRVASPVPAFDCSSQSWARPTLERAEVPFIRGSQGSGPLDFAAEWSGLLSRSSRLGPAGLLSVEGPPSGRRGVMTTVTDEDLLSHLTTDVFAEQQQFVKARSTASPDKRAGAWAARDAGGGGGGGGGEAETVLRTDHAGRVVEVCLPTPERDPHVCMRAFLARSRVFSVPAHTDVLPRGVTCQSAAQSILCMAVGVIGAVLQV